MNTEAIIEHLLQSGNEQILNTPIETLGLPVRVHRGLWRARMRTVGEVAQAWGQIRRVRNVGEGARREILGALQAWSLALSNSTAPGPRAEPGPASPIEALQLSTRTYNLLRQNGFETLADIEQGWYEIAGLWSVGRQTLDEIQVAVKKFYPPLHVEAYVGLNVKGKIHKPRPLPPLAEEWQLAKDVLGEGYERMSQIPVERIGLTALGVSLLKSNGIHTLAELIGGWRKLGWLDSFGQTARDQLVEALQPFQAAIRSAQGDTLPERLPLRKTVFELELRAGTCIQLLRQGFYTIDQITLSRLRELWSRGALDTRAILDIKSAIQAWLDREPGREEAYAALLGDEAVRALPHGSDFEAFLHRMLEPIQVTVLELHYGLTSGEPIPLAQVAQTCGQTLSRIRVVERYARRRLRQPGRLRDLRDSMLCLSMKQAIDSHRGPVPESQLVEQLQARQGLSTYSMRCVLTLLRVILAEANNCGYDTGLVYLPELNAWSRSTPDRGQVLQDDGVISFQQGIQRTRPFHSKGFKEKDGTEIYSS